MKIFALLLVSSIAVSAGNVWSSVRCSTSSLSTNNTAEICSSDYHPDFFYSNGPFVTGIGIGSGGADVSEFQLGDDTYGFGFSISQGWMVADCFTVPTGETWRVSEVTIFGYQTGSSTTPSINDIRLCIYDDAPTTGSIVYGNMMQNVLTSNSWTNCYRINTGDYTNTDRPIMANLCYISSFTLTAGDYWLCFQAGGILGSGPWVNPVTIHGQPSSGVAMRYNAGWETLTQGANGVTLPFLFETHYALSRTTWGEIKSLF